MLKINFAVWNMRGMNKNDQRFTEHRKKINKWLEYKINGKEPLDLVFFQEISNPETVFRENPSDRITRILSASVISFKKKKTSFASLAFGIFLRNPTKNTSKISRRQGSSSNSRSSNAIS